MYILASRKPCIGIIPYRKLYPFITTILYFVPSQWQPYVFITKKEFDV